MIDILGKVFYVDTEKTTYVFKINEVGYLEHIYYGKKIDHIENVESFGEKMDFPSGNGVSYSSDHPNIVLEAKCLEYSSLGKGDVRNPFIDITYADGSSSSDFVYESYEVKKHEAMKTLPSSYGDADDLIITLKEKETGIILKLYYTAYEKENVITRRSVLLNTSENTIKINKIMSTQIDMKNKQFVFASFHGGWIREMTRYDQDCVIGTIRSESLCGSSSSRSNPFVMLYRKGATENNGTIYGFNLVYSGNHVESVETDSFNHLRFMSGINETTFEYLLNKGEEFETPECVMSFTSDGFASLSQSFHQFIENHIVRGEWKDLPRPVLNNSWEAAYFKFNESKLLSMARAASRAGCELFVLDDGWFSTRNDDAHGLGDWKENRKKLRHGLKGLSKEIEKMGMKFGIWVEPEMVSTDTELYKKHPDWAVENPSRTQSLGRNQMFLDLTRKEVRDYIKESMRYVFKEANASYVKWDMNRIMSDYYSSFLEAPHMKEFAHRYIMGLYDILKTLTEEFPHILFESCAAGGNRFDLGMLCFSPQIWASDNTDPIARAKIQYGYSFGYPTSTWGCHVSASPNHQTLRKTPIETRANVAFVGALGYEFNFAELSASDYKKAIYQIKSYKHFRKMFLHGNYFRLIEKNGVHAFMKVSEDKRHAVLVYVQEAPDVNKIYESINLKGLDEHLVYRIRSAAQEFDIHEFGGLINTMSPIHVKQDGTMHNLLSKFIRLKEKGVDYKASGSILMYAGLELNLAFIGIGYNDTTRLMLQNASRIYYLNAVEEEDNK